MRQDPHHDEGSSGFTFRLSWKDIKALPWGYMMFGLFGVISLIGGNGLATNVMATYFPPRVQQVVITSDDVATAAQKAVEPVQAKLVNHINNEYATLKSDVSGLHQGQEDLSKQLREKGDQLNTSINRLEGQVSILTGQPAGIPVRPPTGGIP